jgi:hypothetical protein
MEPTLAMAETDLQQLHDRASRGLPLSEAERQSLIDWYARQDRLEDDLLSQRQGSPLPALRAQIDQSVSQMRHAVERIQVLTAENEVLHREIEALQGRLAGQVSATRA